MPRIVSLLLDRDGTVIEDRHYLKDPQGVAVLPQVTQALAALQATGVQLYLVSNQSGVGRGYFTEADVLACNHALAAQLAPSGVQFADSVFCPHAPEQDCTCRKPGPGMWETLHARHGLAPATTVMVGDKPEDMAFAANAGLAGRFLVATGKGKATIERFGLQEQLQQRTFIAKPAAPELPQYILEDFSALPKAIALLEALPA